MTLLATDQLHVSIAHKKICADLSLSIRSGQCWGLLGANGVGKTTLLYTLAGLRPVDSGQILLKQQSITEMKRREIAATLGVLPQDSSDPFPANVFETVLIGRHPHLSSWQWEGEKDFALARAALENVGMQGFEERQVDTLSGGERRRLAIATLLTQQAPLMLLDEPTNHLDLRHQISMLSLLVETAGKTAGAVLMSLHDINLAVRFCDHLLLLMPDGQVMQGTTNEMLEPEILQSLYDCTLRRIETEEGLVLLPE